MPQAKVNMPLEKRARESKMKMDKKKSMQQVPVQVTFSRTHQTKFNIARARATRVLKEMDSDEMNLDEMLELSKVIEMKLRGEKISIVKSTKVQKYATEVSEVKRCDRGIYIVLIKKMQSKLAEGIIGTNRRTVSEEEGKRLYKELMEE